MDIETQDKIPLEPVQKIDLNKLILPGAIIIAALLISGTLLYTRGAKNPDSQTQQPVLSIDNLKKWARELKLNSKAFNQCLDSGKYKEEVAKDLADGIKAGVEGTPSFFINGKLLEGALPFGSFKAVIDAELSGKKDAVKRIAVSPDDDPVLGSSIAPVTIIEFSDFECPYCRRFFLETLPQIKKDYIDTNKVRLVFRDFPLTIHSGAEPAAQAADCAGEQGKYWEMHDKIFSEQK